jgi:hypothetical protein
MTESIALPTFEPLDDGRVQFFAERRGRVLLLFPTYAQLRNKLLGIGGLEVVLPRYDELSENQRSRQRYETARILDAGKNWPGQLARLEEMEDSNCHVNTAVLFKQGSGLIASGFALSEDGLWREHSWLLDHAGGLIETTVLRIFYHGYVLSDQEQAWFVSSELG